MTNILALQLFPIRYEEKKNLMFSKAVAKKEELSDIIAKCIKNDRKAQKKLFDLFSEAMLHICYNYMKDYDLANDMLQDGFVKVFYNLDKFNGGNFPAWIKTIMINTCINQLRKDKKVEITDLETANYIESNLPDPSGNLHVSDLQKAIDALPNNYRTVLNLYAVDGMSYKEISELLEISEVGARTLVFRARKTLSAKLNYNY